LSRLFEYIILQVGQGVINFSCCFSERWWEEEPQLDLFDEVTVRPGECTLDQMKEALEGVIFADLLPLSTSGDITVSGIVSTPFLIFIQIVQLLIGAFGKKIYSCSVCRTKIQAQNGQIKLLLRLDPEC
jgi:hypothetical protein